MAVLIGAWAVSSAPAAPTPLEAVTGGGGGDGGTNAPQIQVTADGDNRIEGGKAIAEKNVEILYGGTSLYADKVIYDTATGWADAEGAVRIYGPGGFLWTGDKVRFNMKTREIESEGARFGAWPIVGSTEQLRTVKGPEGPIYEWHSNLFTTEDRAEPGFKVKPRTIVYDPQENRWVLRNATVYAGGVPVFWVPVLVYHPGAGPNVGLQFEPGFDSEWGAYLLTTYGLEITKKVRMRLHADVRSERGAGGGFDLKWIYGERKGNSDEGTLGQGQASVYGVQDNEPEEGGDPGRYRVDVAQRLYLNTNRGMYATVVANKLSDARFERDFFEDDFRKERVPDNFAEVVGYDPNFTLTLLARQQGNDFFETVEREPEILLEIKRQNLLPGSSLEYNGQSSFVQLDRKFSNEDDNAPNDYNAMRADTYHQLSLPGQVGGWLNLNPRLGWRGTWYSDSWGDKDNPVALRPDEEDFYRSDDDDDHGDGDGDVPRVRGSGGDGGAIFRSAVNAGMEMSFKLSKTWDVENPEWGISGIRHVVEPFADLAWMPNPSVSADRIMQFDTQLPSTRLQPLNFPEITSIDSLDNMLIARTGFRQRWQTHRDGRNWNYVEWSTYIDFDLENQHYNDNLTSNLYNEFLFRPVQWMRFEAFASTGLYDDSHQEYNTRLTWQILKPVEISLSTRYLNGHPQFRNSNEIGLGLYWRIDENWAASTRHVFEAEDSTLDYQEYSLYRDLTAWRMAFTTQIRDNRGGEDEYLFFLTLTLKAFPDTKVPVGYNPGTEQPLSLGQN